MANKSKSHKSLLKRFKVSAGGKIQHRHVRLNHFNSKDSGSVRRKKRGQQELSKSDSQTIRQLL